MASIAGGVLSATIIDSARTDLRKLLETPEVAGAGKLRSRLQTRLEQLKKQHEWGDLTDAEYLAKRDATRSELAALPDSDRIRAFEANRARVLALPDAIDVASPKRREELCRIVVQRVIVRDRPAGSDRMDAGCKAVLRKTAGVPPRGLGNPPAAY